MNRIPRGIEGRRIRKIHVCEILDTHAGPQGAREDVHTLHGAPCANGLRAEEHSCRTIRDQLDAQFFLSGERGSEGVSPYERGRGMIAALLGFDFVDACSSRSKIKNLKRLRAHDTGEYDSPAGDVGAGDAPLFIGNIAERDVRPFPAYALIDLAAIADGINVGIRGALRKIDLNRPFGLPQQPKLLQRRLR